MEDLRGEWLDLIRQARIEEADELYWKELFPLVESKFLSENKAKEQYDWLVLPCGLESSYYVLLIRALNPKNVYFIGTQEFKDNFLNMVVEKSGIKASQYIVDVVSYDEMNVSDVYEKIRGHLDLFADKKIILDLTRGKRILSVGAGIVGAFFGFDMVYVDEGWDDKIKRGIPGTERLVMVKNPFEVFGDLELREAKEFFNHYDYGPAIFFYNKLRERVVDPRVIEVERLLAETYMYWNSFNFKAALTKLEMLRDREKQYNLKGIGKTSSHIEVLKILIDENNKNDDYNLHLIVDLYANALRKAEIGLFEDSISRMYRVLELISQYRLRSYGIETSQPNVKHIESEYRNLTKEIYGFEKDLPLEVGLKDGYLMLYSLKDYLLEGISTKDLKDMFGVIRARDNSIIAHGTHLAGEKVFLNMKSLARKFIEKISSKLGKNVNVLIEEHGFVKI